MQYIKVLIEVFTITVVFTVSWGKNTFCIDLNTHSEVMFL